MRTIVSAATLSLAIIAPAHANTIDCTGTLTFNQGAETYLGCDGSLRLDDGLLLEADTSISLWASHQVSLANATLRAPTISISAGMIDVAAMSILNAGELGARINNLEITSPPDSLTPARREPLAHAGGVILSGGAIINLASDRRPLDRQPAGQSWRVEGGRISLSGRSITALTSQAGQPWRVEGGRISLSGGSITALTSQAGQPPISAIPEPETWSMLLAGLSLGVAAMRRKRRPGAITCNADNRF